APYPVGMGECPPTRTRPSGRSAAVLWYVLPWSAVAMGVHVPVAGSNSSACRTGKPVPGPTTSSRFAPENAITWPVGRSTPVEYHRALLSEPVIVEVNASAWAVSTVSIWPNGVARYEPGVTPTI